MTAAERLLQLSKLSGVAAASMLLAIGAGATTGEALVDYSHIDTATAAEHLLAERVQQSDGGALLRASQAQTKRVVDAVSRESKAKQRQEELRKALEQAPEEPQAPESLPIEYRAGKSDQVAPVASQTVEEVARLEPLAPVNDLLRKISYATDKNVSVAAITDDSSPTVKDSLTVGNDDDDALALIMILAEMD